ncbi:MerR family DNA-binding transcriptional regulator, partial [Kitasatospora sp. NPDC093558]|uniref:MerR family DNA-binding transcriptional regulator n=1 Tax=Kitasatospora sp. NPDC093558 TaxID=3155201 RepID=UPI003420A2CB
MKLRPVDLAREHGLSTQAVRNYEEAGYLPPAERTPSGYRVYGPRHAAALRAFLALLPGHGHATAGAVMRAVHAGEVDEALRLIDASHEQLAGDRATLDAVEEALQELVPPSDLPPAPEGGGTFIGPLAHRLGLRPATLRTWERAGLVVPRRDPHTGYRVYAPADVRDALLAHQLRRGGHGLERIAHVL